MADRANLKAAALAVLLLAGMFAVPGLAYSSTRISESFNQPAGGLPEGWVAARRGAGIAEVAALPGILDRNALLVQRPAAGAQNAMAYYTGSQGQVSEGKMKDFTATVIINLQRTANSSSSGVVVRAQNRNYAEFDGYFVCVGGFGREEGLAIYWNPGNHIARAGDYLVLDSVKLTPGVDYQLRVGAKGKVIEASLWTLNPVGDTDEQIASVKIENAEQDSPGLFGLRGAYGNSGPIGAFFRDLHIEVTSTG